MDHFMVTEHGCLYTSMGKTTSDLMYAGGCMTEFRQPLQVQSHLEMPRILVQLGHTQRT